MLDTDRAGCTAWERIAAFLERGAEAFDARQTELQLVQPGSNR